jgi:hypothetical protein
VNGRRLPINKTTDGRIEIHGESTANKPLRWTLTQQ